MPPTSGACRRQRPRSGCAQRLGPAYRVAAIGPAGERLVRYATVSHDGRHAGRGGLGAVLGAKRLKAVAVRAATRCPVADPDAVLAAAKDLRARSFGPATAKYRDLGTLVQPADLQRALRAPGPQLRHRDDDARARGPAPPCATAARRARSAASGS